MMYNYWNGYTGYTLPGLVAGWIGVLLIPLMIWSLFWKGWALWKAAKNDSKVWFIVLLLINTVGILDIIYIFLVAKKKSRK
jgi:hypothetical protein